MSLVHADFQIVKDRERRYDLLLHRDPLERSEAEEVLVYYMLRNIGVTCYFLFGVELLPYQEMILRMLMRKPFPMLILTRGGGKSFILGVYSALRAVLSPGSKVVIVGANRRQARFVFAEVGKIYNNNRASLFREIAKKPVDAPEESYVEIRGPTKTSRVSAFPIAMGDRIRGARASCLIADEFAIIPEDIYTTVLKPMGAVAMNPVEKVRRVKRERELVDAGIIKEEEMVEQEANQIILSSSASYQYTFLYKQYAEYKTQVKNAILNPTEKTKRIASKYAIIQLGWEAINELAPGYLDLDNIESAKITSSRDRFETEYGAKFVSDSEGFFPRSLLDSRTYKLGESPIIEIEGEAKAKYIMSVDPSSGENLTNDFFAIMIGKLDIENGMFTVVNAHASTGKGWPHYVKLVRRYMRLFHPVYITMDKFGGGSQVQSLLSSEEYLDKSSGDSLVLPMEKDDPLSYKPLENRILRMVVFDPQWIEQANIHMKSMLDHKRMWYAAPPNDASYRGTEEQVDGFDDAQEFIEMAKMQASMIIGEQNSKGLTSFKMPESLAQLKKKERVRKDLYSASLLLAWAAKEYFGILAGNMKKNKTYTPAFVTA